MTAPMASSLYYYIKDIDIGNIYIGVTSTQNASNLVTSLQNTFIESAYIRSISAVQY